MKNDELLETYNEISRKVKSRIKNEFDSETVYNEKYLKAKTKSLMGKLVLIFTVIKCQKKVVNLFV